MSAGRSKHAPGLATEGRWREAGQRMEARAERAQAFVPGLEANVGHPVIACQEQPLCVIDPEARHKLVRRFGERVREQAVKVKRR